MVFNALGKGMAWLKHWNRKESEKLENKPSSSAKDSLIWSRKEGVLAVGHISSVISTLTAFDRVYMRSPRTPEEAIGERNSTRLSKIWLEKSPKRVERVCRWVLGRRWLEKETKGEEWEGERCGEHGEWQGGQLELEEVAKQFLRHI